MSKRPTISKARRLRIFLANDRRCHLCTRDIGEGEIWEVEHVKARGLGGSDDDANLKPAHVNCHDPKTRDDRKIMAKADRAGKRHAGLVKPKSSLSRPRERRPMLAVDGDAKANRLKAKHDEHQRKMNAKGGPQ